MEFGGGGSLSAWRRNRSDRLLLRDDLGVVCSLGSNEPLIGYVLQPFYGVCRWRFSMVDPRVYEVV